MFDPLRERWAIFISGQGSNMRSLLDLPQLLNCHLVVSSRASATGVFYARRRGIPVELVKLPSDWSRLQQLLELYNIQKIFLLGFMKLLPADFVKNWQHKILNIHPSLLPAYAGLDSIARAYNDKESVGVTIHEVTEEMDAGPIITQRISVDKKSMPYLTLEESEFLTHTVEQRMLREFAQKWMPVPTLL